jgi:hypothetical protein
VTCRQTGPAIFIALGANHLEWYCPLGLPVPTPGLRTTQHAPGRQAGDAQAVLAEIVRTIAPGSYVVISIPASDIDAERQAAAADLLVHGTGISVRFRRELR